MTFSWKILVVLSLLISGILFYQVNVLSTENSLMNSSIEDQTLRTMSLTKSYLQLRLESKEDRKQLQLVTAVLLQALRDSDCSGQRVGIIQVKNK